MVVQGGDSVYVTHPCQNAPVVSLTRKEIQEFSFAFLLKTARFWTSNLGPPSPSTLETSLFCTYLTST